ncbi:glycosyltransferase, partial [Lactobacillus crispatus]|uniref:glycosyltransferase n=1 Tax=Lactobacillus crispatus TaxID=47770 RepID=UPI0018E31D30
IVTVGRLTEQKGYDISIKAAKNLRDRGINFKWFAIGEGKDRYKLQRLISKLNLSNNFFLIGRRDNPYPYIKNCDLYVQFSRHEGYGLSVLEARILDKPIVVSDLPVFKEQIKNRWNGLIVHFDQNNLANSIEELYADYRLRNKIKTNVLKESINFDSQMSKLDKI